VQIAKRSNLLQCRAQSYAASTASHSCARPPACSTAEVSNWTLLILCANSTALMGRAERSGRARKRRGFLIFGGTQVSGGETEALTELASALGINLSNS
jgi:hypothetical protein